MEAPLLQWYYLIYLVPLGVASLLLLLSTVRIGHHHGGHGLRIGHAGHGSHVAQQAGHAVGSAQAGHAAAQGPSGVSAASPHAAHGASAAAHASPAAAAHGAAGHPAPQHAHVRAPHGRDVRQEFPARTGVLLVALGSGRAPLSMVLEAGCVAWGAIGCWANGWLISGPAPTLAQIAPGIGMALAGGVVGGRIAAGVIGRLIPQEGSQDVSRDSLFGLFGEIAFPVSADAGRIHIYDEFGTLHVESCRVAPGHPPIQRGHRAMVVDIDTSGRLIVEEIP